MNEQVYKVASYDTGRTRDGFGMVGSNIAPTNIQVFNAQSWYSRDVTIVAQEIAKINEKVKFDIHLIESNNGGHYVVDILKRYHGIHPILIPTVKDVKDERKLRQGTTMPKYATIDYLESCRQAGIVKMPKQPWTKGIKELNRQLQNYVARQTATGVSYEAEDPDIHDDLVMALAIQTHYARSRLLSLSGRIGFPIAMNNPEEELKSPEDKNREMVLKKTIGRFKGDGLKFGEPERW